MRRVTAGRELAAPVLLIVVVALIGSATSVSTQQNFITALVSVAVVIGLYVFMGNSGVISFGQISFVAVGAYVAGELTIPTQPKHFVLSNLWSFLQNTSVGNVPSLAIAAGVGALFALLVGIPLMRLSGLSAGIATFAVLEITNNLLTFWPKIAPQSGQTLSLVPTTTGLFQAAAGAWIDTRTRPRRRSGSASRFIGSGWSRSPCRAPSRGWRAGCSSTRSARSPQTRCFSSSPS